MNLITLLTEDIYGSVATVYHRCKNKETVAFLYNHNWKSGLSVGALYGDGIYTCFELSYAGVRGHRPAWNNPGLYGDYLLQGKVERLDQFFIFDPELYCKVHHKKDSGDYIREQNKRFGTSISGDKKTIETLGMRNIGNFASKYKIEARRCRGIIFKGKNDGPVLFAFNPYSFKPVKIMYDPKGKASGKWENVKDFVYDFKDKEGNNFSKDFVKKYDRNDVGMPDEIDKDNPKNFKKRDKEGFQYEKDGWKLYRCRTKDAVKEALGNFKTYIEHSGWWNTTLDNFMYRGRGPIGARSAYVITNESKEKIFIVGFAMGSEKVGMFEIRDQDRQEVDVRKLKQEVPMQIFNKIYDFYYNRNISQALKKSEETMSQEEKNKEKEVEQLNKRNSEAYDKAEKEISDKYNNILDSRKNRRVINPRQDLEEYLKDKSNYGEKKIVNGVTIYTMKNFAEEIANESQLFKDQMDYIKHKNQYRRLNPKDYYLNNNNSHEYKERIKSIIKGEKPKAMKFADKDELNNKLANIGSDKEEIVDNYFNSNAFKKTLGTVGYKTPAKLYIKDDEKAFVYYLASKYAYVGEKKPHRETKVKVYKNNHWEYATQSLSTTTTFFSNISKELFETIKADWFGEKHAEREEARNNEKIITNKHQRFVEELKKCINNYPSEDSKDKIKEIRIIKGIKGITVNWFTEKGRLCNIRRNSQGEYIISGINYEHGSHVIEDKHMINILEILNRGK